MDKQTLSNYGWGVVLVLILAVLLALASPFGSFVTGTIEINANPTSYSSCFSGVKFISQGITLTGSSTMLDTLKATGSNS